MNTILDQTNDLEKSFVVLSCGIPGIRTGLKLSDVKPSHEATLEFIASDDTLDRAGEIIRPEGWQLDRYRQNPIFQNSHQYGDIIFTIGKSEQIEVRRRNNGACYLYQRVRFAVDENPFARIAYDLYKGGFLNAVSVGFRPIRWLEGKEATPARRVYVEQELVEVSAVAIPANHNALALSAKTGITKPQDIKACLELVRFILATYRKSGTNTELNYLDPINKTTGFRLHGCREKHCLPNQTLPEPNPWRQLRLMFTALTEALNKINAE